MNGEQFLKTVELQLGRKGVKMSDRFIEDLGAESLDLVNLAVVIEEQTGIFVAVEAVPELNTVQDFYDYLLSISSL